jgi:microcystin-dependent protein
MPSHNHDVLAANFNASDNLPTSNDLARGAGGLNAYAPPGTIVNMSLNALTPIGGSQPHKNLQPYLTLNYCIALQGIFPPRD